MKNIMCAILLILLVFASGSGTQNPLVEEITPPHTKRNSVSGPPQRLATAIAPCIEQGLMVTHYPSMFPKEESLEKKVTLNNASYWETIAKLTQTYNARFMPAAGKYYLHSNKSDQSLNFTDGIFTHETVLIHGELRESTGVLVLGLYPTPAAFCSEITLQINQVTYGKEVVSTKERIHKTFDNKYGVHCRQWLLSSQRELEAGETVNVEGEFMGLVLRQIVSIDCSKHADFEVSELGHLKIKTKESCVDPVVGQGDYKMSGTHSVVKAKFTPSALYTTGSQYTEDLYWICPIPKSVLKKSITDSPNKIIKAYNDPMKDHLNGREYLYQKVTPTEISLCLLGNSTESIQLGVYEPVALKFELQAKIVD